MKREGKREKVNFTFIFFYSCLVGFHSNVKSVSKPPQISKRLESLKFPFWDHKRYLASPHLAKILSTKSFFQLMTSSSTRITIYLQLLLEPSLCWRQGHKPAFPILTCEENSHSSAVQNCFLCMETNFKDDYMFGIEDLKFLKRFTGWLWSF